MIVMMVPAMKRRRRRRKRNTKAPFVQLTQYLYPIISYTIRCVKRFTNYRFARGSRAEPSPGVLLREVKTPPGAFEKALTIDPGCEEARTYPNQLPASK